MLPRDRGTGLATTTAASSFPLGVLAAGYIHCALTLLKCPHTCTLHYTPGPKLNLVSAAAAAAAERAGDPTAAFSHNRPDESERQKPSVSWRGEKESLNGLICDKRDLLGLKFAGCVSNTNTNTWYWSGWQRAMEGPLREGDHWNPICGVVPHEWDIKSGEDDAARRCQQWRHGQDSPFSPPPAPHSRAPKPPAGPRGRPIHRTPANRKVKVTSCLSISPKAD